MLSKEEIEKARRILLRGNDIESAALILRAMILEGWTEIGGRVNILKVATVEILDFIEEHKNKRCLDVVREKVKANEKAKQLEEDKQKLIEKLEEDIKDNQENYDTNADGFEDYWRGCLDTEKEILELVKGEKHE